MNESVEWWSSIRSFVNIALRDYVQHPYRTQKLDLKYVYSPIIDSPTPKGSLSQNIDRVESVCKYSDDVPELNQLDAVPLGDPTILPKLNAVTAIAATAIDLVHQEFPDGYQFSSPTWASLIEDIESNSLFGSDIEDCADQFSTRLINIRKAHEIEQTLPEIVHPDTAPEKESIIKKARRAVRESDVELLDSLHRCYVNCRWVPADFSAFDYREFEHLIKTLYTTQGYEATVAPKGPDGGIDLIAKKEDLQKLIQVKNVTKAISGPQLDQYVSLFEYHDVDEVVVVTSSSFTAPARKRSSQVDNELRLINGNDLAHNLTQARIAVPFSTDTA